MEYLRLLLIEEPQAHLHPQLQTRLLKHLQDESRPGLQVVVTSHSPILAVRCRPRLGHSRLLPFRGKAGGGPTVGLWPVKGEHFVHLARLDATKSVLLFARGVILVEGIAEAILLPVLAERLLTGDPVQLGGGRQARSLADAGVSVINMNGIYFRHFMQLFSNLSCASASSLPVLCAGVTDNDPLSDAKPTALQPAEGRNPALRLREIANASTYGRLFVCPLKTFEYDLAMEGGNVGVMAQVLAELWPADRGSIRSELQALLTREWGSEPEECKAEASYRMLELITDDNVGKGAFAQALADKLEPKEACDFDIPAYIGEALRWVMPREHE